MFILVFVSYDSELGRTWLAGGVDRQFRTGLIFVNVIIIVIINVIITARSAKHGITIVSRPSVCLSVRP